MATGTEAIRGSAGVLMARHELWLRDHCQHVQGTIVGQVCGEGPPCEKEVQFTDERGALRRALSPRPTGEVGTPATVCFLPGGESSKVYFRGDEANGIILALWASVWVIGEIRVLTSILREKTGRAS
jgi:hypothetical protein